ncbi:MAG: ferredoxin [Bacteroidetes bacterium]|nr:ferredoxin [Bacteroidota bacterium]
MNKASKKTAHQLSARSLFIWRAIQIAVWIVGASILFNLIFFPKLGIHLFWNILIPVAPALLVVGVGIWRNVCPMASNALFARHMGISKRKKLSISQSGKLNLIAVIALFLIVPLRHAFFDLNGFYTAMLILSLGLIAVVTGFFFEWKSAWCSGLCPVHPVEKLYGLNHQLSLPNAHCDRCHRCVTPCPDSTPGITPFSSKKTKVHKVSGFLMVATFPGFVWGWFQVPDVDGISSFGQLLGIYKMPFLGMLASIVLYLVLNYFFKKKELVAIFSASAVSCYYWYRLPALFGFGLYPLDGVLVDLSGVLPSWIFTVLAYTTTLFFFWWILFKKPNKFSWVNRPVFAEKE